MQRQCSCVRGVGGHARRQANELKMVLNAQKAGPPTDPKDAIGWTHAFKTNMTIEQLQEAFEGANK